MEGCNSLGYVTLMSERRSEYGWVEKAKGEVCLGGRGADGRAASEWILKKWGGSMDQIYLA